MNQDNVDTSSTFLYNLHVANELLMVERPVAVRASVSLHELASCCIWKWQDSIRIWQYNFEYRSPARCRKALWSPKSGKTYRYRYLVSLNLEILPYSRTYPGMVLAALPRPRVDTWWMLRCYPRPCAVFGEGYSEQYNLGGHRNNVIIMSR